MKKINTGTRYGIFLLTSLLFAGSAAATPTAAADNKVATPSSKGIKFSPIGSESPSYLHNLVSRADLIFHGKVVDISEGMSIEEIPYTFITYQVNEVIAGNYHSDTITVKFVGGTFPNGNKLSATNTPTIKLDEQSILMVQKRKDTGCDFVDCEHGRFLIDGNKVFAANESAIVVDDKGGVDYISLAGQRRGTHEASLQKSNVRSFINHLKLIDQSKGDALQSVRADVQDTNIHQAFHAYKALTQAMAGPKVPSSIAKKAAPEPTGSAQDQWELEQLRQNGGNPVLNSTFSGGNK